MGQQQLPQQLVLSLLCLTVGHLRVAPQRSLELDLRAMRAAHGVWGIGKCLAGMRVRRLPSGVVFFPVPTVTVQQGCGAVPLPVSWVAPLSRRARWVYPSSSLATCVCHCSFRLYSKVRTCTHTCTKASASTANLWHVVWHGMAGLKPHQKNVVFFMPGWPEPSPDLSCLCVFTSFWFFGGVFLVDFFA